MGLRLPLIHTQLVYKRGRMSVHHVICYTQSTLRLNSTVQVVTVLGVFMHSSSSDEVCSGAAGVCCNTQP